MEWQPAAPLVSFMIMTLLVVSTGTAWFIVLHPLFIWRMSHRGTESEDPPAEYRLSVRWGSFGFGTAGLLLLFLADLYPS